MVCLFIHVRFQCAFCEKFLGLESGSGKMGKAMDGSRLGCEVS